MNLHELSRKSRCVCWKSTNPGATCKRTSSFIRHCCCTASGSTFHSLHLHLLLAAWPAGSRTHSSNAAKIASSAPRAHTLVRRAGHGIDKNNQPRQILKLDESPSQISLLHARYG